MSTAAPKDQRVPDGAESPGAHTPEEDRALARLARAIAPHSLQDIGFEIPWVQRLSVRLLGMVGVIAIVTVGAFFLAEIGVQRHLLSQVVAESDLLSATIRNALHRSMLQDRRADAYAIMEDVGRQPGIEKIRLFDENGVVTYSTAQGEAGRQVDRKAESCVACHLDSGPIHAVGLEERSRVYRQDGRRMLGVITAFHNDASCSTAACHAHGPDRKVLGVLDVSVSLSRLDAETRDFRWLSLAIAALVALSLALFVWFFARHQVIQPVAALLQATRRVSRDQLELEIPVTWSGELGLLAASFNDMTRRLRGARAEVDGLMHSLERQVKERTAALEAAQEQLVRNEKLSSLGKLSASIAHEINNPLAGILTFAKLIVRNLDQGVPDEAGRKAMVKNLLLVQRETERCSAIVRNLLDFARERPLTVVEVDPNAVVDEALQLLANQIAIQGVTIDKKLGPIPTVQGDFGQLRQACVNVIMNACEAMQRGGRLAIESAMVENGRWVELAFTDTGPGIAPDHLSKIFDPFFTTKERGTGLGLSVVYGIVERHAGKIELRSEVGKGTRVAIRLPPLAGAAPHASAGAPAGTGAPVPGAQ
ncbi:MAG: ATP-binding protein [Anaeromyxobacter sp.]